MFCLVLYNIYHISNPSIDDISRLDTMAETRESEPRIQDDDVNVDEVSLLVLPPRHSQLIGVGARINASSSSRNGRGEE
jgi:hypothetical protein